MASGYMTPSGFLPAPYHEFGTNDVLLSQQGNNLAAGCVREFRDFVVSTEEQSMAPFRYALERNVNTFQHNAVPIYEVGLSSQLSGRDEVLSRCMRGACFTGCPSFIPDPIANITQSSSMFPIETKPIVHLQTADAIQNWTDTQYTRTEKPCQPLSQKMYGNLQFSYLPANPQQWQQINYVTPHGIGMDDRNAFKDQFRRDACYYQSKYMKYQ